MLTDTNVASCPPYHSPKSKMIIPFNIIIKERKKANQVNMKIGVASLVTEKVVDIKDNTR